MTCISHSPVLPDACVAWRRPPTRPSLQGDALHLWHLRTDHRGLNMDSAMAVLDAGQRLRASGMRQAGHRERWVRAQAGLRRILGRYLDVDPSEVRLARSPTGKPALTGPQPGLAFNLTTSGDLALVVLSPCQGSRSGIGVDCEWIRPRAAIDALARRMFAPQLVSEIVSAHTPHARLLRFYAAWTALEADVKADGRGLFGARSPGMARPEVAHCIPEPGYLAAVARVALPAPPHWCFYRAD